MRPSIFRPQNSIGHVQAKPSFIPKKGERFLDSNNGQQKQSLIDGKSNDNEREVTEYKMADDKSADSEQEISECKVSDEKEGDVASTPDNSTPQANPPLVQAAPAPTITFDEVNSSSTPATMAVKRIPPRVTTPIGYNLKDASAGMNNVEISVENGNSTNGNATINGLKKAKTKSSGSLNLKGNDQTTVGNENKLRLIAKLDGAEIGASNFFSVSAIPQNWNSIFVSLLTGAKRGFVVNDGWESDSGVFADLDQTEISEQVDYHSGKGVFAGLKSGINSGYLPGNSLTTDSHGYATSGITAVGEVFANQACIFKDKRTNVKDVTMKNTGYQIKREVTEPTPGSFEITTSKTGMKVTANGYTTNAGGGATVSKKQKV